MFCTGCGKAMEDATRFCPECGADNEEPKAGAEQPPPAPARPSATALAAAQLRSQAGTASRDAFGALRTMLIEPVSGLPSAFSSLGEERAFAAGIALCVIFALACTVGILFGAGSLSGLTRGFIDASEKVGIKEFLKISFVFLIPPGTLFAVVFALSKMFGTTGTVGSAAFSAGASLSPIGIAVLASGLLGIANFEVVIILFSFAWCYMILMLYTGLSGACGVNEKASAPAVPVACLATIWLSKVIIIALASHRG